MIRKRNVMQWINKKQYSKKDTETHYRNARSPLSLKLLPLLPLTPSPVLPLTRPPAVLFLSLPPVNSTQPSPTPYICVRLSVCLSMYLYIYRQIPRASPHIPTTLIAPYPTVTTTTRVSKLLGTPRLIKCLTCR